MTMDRRFPWLTQIEHAPEDVRHRAGSTASRIANRTFTKVLWNQFRRRYHFFIDDPAVGVYEWHPSDNVSEDQAVMVMQRSRRMSLEDKERKIEADRKNQESDANERLGQKAHEIATEATKVAERKRQHREMGKHWRGSAVVDGSKA